MDDKKVFIFDSMMIDIDIDAKINVWALMRFDYFITKKE